jgi:hypothetical protein
MSNIQEIVYMREKKYYESMFQAQINQRDAYEIEKTAHPSSSLKELKSYSSSFLAELLTCSLSVFMSIEIFITRRELVVEYYRKKGY